jgi:Aspartyl protease
MTTHEGAAIAEPVIGRALVDTGATTTCISARVAEHLKMQPIGKVPVQGVSQVSYHNSYLFMVAFPFALGPGFLAPAALPPPKPGEIQSQLHVLKAIIQGCEFDPGKASFDVLLGMDVLHIGTLVVQGDGSFSFSF